MRWSTGLIRALSVLLVAGSVAGCCKQKEEPVRVGSEVEAPWSSAGTMYPGRVTELYGKLAHIKFDDGDEGWALVTELDPPGTPAAVPSDGCGVRVGDRVLAPWSKTKKMYAGRVSDVHGKLALVNFDDGDRGWALCAEMQKP